MSSTEATSSITVLSSIDGKHYKMVMKGDVGQLSVSKVKRYLQHATGIEPRDQRLTYEQRLLFDHEVGLDFGLHDGAIIILGLLNSSRGGPSGGEVQQRQSTTLSSSSTGQQTLSLRATTSPRRVAAADDTSTVAQNIRELQQQQQQVWLAQELQRVRDEEREKYELEKRKREENEQYREIERARIMERSRLMEEDFREMETRYKIECEKLRLSLSREERLTQELREKIQILEEDRVCEAESSKEERRRAEADLTRKEKERQVADEEMERLVIRLHREIDALRIENTELDRKLREHKSAGGASSPSLSVSRTLHRETSPLGSSPVARRASSCSAMLTGNLRELARELSIPPLTLDANNTCIVSIDGVNLILTFDPNTERLFLYTTLLNNLPADPATRLQLYEELLQGALLGRDIAGGCVGVSKSPNRLILLSTTFDLAHVDDTSLRSVIRPFVSAARKWTEQVRSVCSGEIPRAPSLAN